MNAAPPSAGPFYAAQPGCAIFTALTRKFTLGKSERLKSRKAIDALFQSGKRLSAGPCRAFYSRTEGKGSLQCGFGVSKRYFRKAITRNRIKRLLRETWRRQKYELQQQAIQQHCDISLFILYQSGEVPGYTEMEKHMERLIQKLAHENVVTHT